MELEETFYHVSSDMDEVEVCVVMKMDCDCVDNCHCPLTFAFNLTLTVTGRVILCSYTVKKSCMLSVSGVYRDFSWCVSLWWSVILKAERT